MKVPSVADMHEGLLEMLRERTRVEPVILSANAGMGDSRSRITRR